MKGLSHAAALLLSLTFAVPGHAYARKGGKTGKTATTQGGNQVQTTYTFNKDQFGNDDVLNLQAQTAVQGGNTKSSKRWIFERDPESFEIHIREAEPELIYERDAYPDPYAEAEAFLNGGAAKGGNSKSRGGNEAHNSNSVDKTRFGAGTNLQIGNSVSQSGGNTFGGNGGMNRGAGGAGGSLSMPIQLPPIPARRWLHARDEEALLHLYERVAEADPLLNGGGAKGGSSNTNGGNRAMNSNNLKGDNFGPGASLSICNAVSQKGGNVLGGSGGANFGNGGKGGGFSMPIQMPPMTRDLYEHLYERDAEPEAYYLEERDAYVGPYDEDFGLFERDAYAEADAEADVEAEAHFYEDSY